MNAAAPAVPIPRKVSALLTCVLAALAGLMFGLDIGVISGATQFIQAEFKVTDHTIEWIVSAMMFGAAIGAAIAGWLSVRLGRKRSLILSAALFTAGSLLCGGAWSPDTLIAARFVLGLAIGIAAFTAPLYLAEVASEDVRGAMISIYQLMITIGIFIAFLSDTAFSYSGNWRWMLGIIAIPGALFLVGVLMLPDSPRWLIMRQRKDEAIGCCSVCAAIPLSSRAKRPISRSSSRRRSKAGIFSSRTRTSAAQSRSGLRCSSCSSSPA